MESISSKVVRSGIDCLQRKKARIVRYVSSFNPLLVLGIAKFQRWRAVQVVCSQARHGPRHEIIIFLEGCERNSQHVRESVVVYSSLKYEAAEVG